MSNCIKELNDYDLIKKCTNVEIFHLKSNFLDKIKIHKDGIISTVLLQNLGYRNYYNIENRDHNT